LGAISLSSSPRFFALFTTPSFAAARPVLHSLARSAAMCPSPSICTFQTFFHEAIYWPTNVFDDMEIEVTFWDVDCLRTLLEGTTSKGACTPSSENRAALLAVFVKMDMYDLKIALKINS
jgi:hypothetical protein